MTTAIEKPTSVRGWLQHPMFLHQLKQVTPKTVGLTPERVAQIAITQLKVNPKIGDCSPESVLGCVMLSAQFGLDPGGPAGLAYLVPYGKECTFLLGYKGMITLAIRNGQIAKIEAVIVCVNDHFKIIRGTKPMIEHEPKHDGADILGCYAVAFFKDGTYQFEFMPKHEIDAIRKRSRAAGGPWATDYTEMARKTVVRRLCKYLSLSPEVQAAVSIDEQADYGSQQDLPIIDVQAMGMGKETVTRSESTAAKLKAKAAPKEIVQEPEPTAQLEESAGDWTLLEEVVNNAAIGDTFEVSVSHLENASYPKGHRFKVSGGGVTATIWTPANGPLTDAVMAAENLLFRGGTVVNDKGERKYIAEAVEVA